MANFWSGGSRASMPLGGDWWGTASAMNGGTPASARSLDFKAPGAGLQNALATEPATGQAGRCKINSCLRLTDKRWR